MISFSSLITFLGAGLIISSVIFNRNIIRDIKWTVIDLSYNSKQREKVMKSFDQLKLEGAESCGLESIGLESEDVADNESVSGASLSSPEWEDEFEVINSSMGSENHQFN